jgi:polyisoprenoid-binding protein YceI
LACRTCSASAGEYFARERHFSVERGGRLLRISARITILALVCLFACATRLRAQEVVVKFDPASAAIQFTLGATMHSVHGAFTLKSGEVRVDGATGKASGAIVVDATSGDSGDSSRDHNMHAHVLESAKYPEIIFSPAQITASPGHTLAESLVGKGTSQLQAAGTFTLHGQPHDMTLNLAVENNGNGGLQISTGFPVPYVKWGLKSPNTFILRVSDAVQLEIQAAAQIAQAR